MVGICLSQYLYQLQNVNALFVSQLCYYCVFLGQFTACRMLGDIILLRNTNTLRAFKNACCLCAAEEQKSGGLFPLRNSDVLINSRSCQFGQLGKL